MQANGFDDYSVSQYKSLFWAIPTKDRILNPSFIPTNLGSRFVELFKILLEKGVYLSPNAYEVGFCSIAHNEDVQKDLKDKLWS